MKHFTLAAAVLITGMALVSAQAQSRGSAEDPGQLGHYAIGHTSYMLADASRSGRPVYLDVWYPADPGSVHSSTPPAPYPLDPYSTNLPVSKSTDWQTLGYDPAFERIPVSRDDRFPLVMFSPGWGDDSWQEIFIGTRLASHGYVVAVVDHYADCTWGWSACDDLWTIMYNRPRDLSFGITSLLGMNEKRGQLLFHAIDADKIAAAGHSLGGYAAFAMAAGDNEVCDAQYEVLEGQYSQPYPQSTCVSTPPDHRVKAIVTMDGSAWGLQYRELARIAVPSLLLGEPGDNFIGLIPDGSARDFVSRPHAAIGRADSLRVDVTGANHYSFTNYCDAAQVALNLGIISPDDYASWMSNWPCASTGPAPVTISSADEHLAVTKYTIAFLDLNLKGPDRDPAIDNWILTEKYALSHVPAVQFFADERCKAALPDRAAFSYRPFQTGSECVVSEKDPAGWFLSQ